VVTTSLLESAVRDAAGPAASLRIVRLLPPDSCPGHFDLSPRILPELRAAAAVVRHDYQGVLDEKIRQMGAGEIVPIPVKISGSLLIPAHYAEVVRQVSAALRGRLRGLPSEIRGVEERLKHLEEDLRGRPRPWEGRPALASHNQRLFAEWLGLKVTGILKRPDDVTPADLERLMSCEAEIVVANLQEGAQAALALAERRKIPAAVFSNFPASQGYGRTYEELLRENLRRLETAWAKR
jgi:zinc transport system substrate-binding protein